MIMMEVVNTVAPGIGPVVAGKFLFQPGGTGISSFGESIAIKQKRVFAVGYLAVVLKKECLGMW